MRRFGRHRSINRLHVLHTGYNGHWISFISLQKLLREKHLQPLTPMLWCVGKKMYLIPFITLLLGFILLQSGVISCRFRSIQASYRVLLLNRYWFLHKVDPFFSNLPSSADWSWEWVDLHPFGGVWNPLAVVVCILILIDIENGLRQATYEGESEGGRSEARGQCQLALPRHTGIRHRGERSFWPCIFCNALLCSDISTCLTVIDLRCSFTKIQKQYLSTLSSNYEWLTNSFQFYALKWIYFQANTIDCNKSLEFKKNRPV